jgi:tRNA A37 threonylcarbamoyladenosine dehydratase
MYLFYLRWIYYKRSFGDWINSHNFIVRILYLCEKCFFCSMEIPYWMGRTQLMLGDEQVNKLLKANVLVVGLGGVGGICAEMIARAGVRAMTIVDADTVDPSNRNRQIPALKSTEHQLKAEVMAQRLLDINPELELTVLCEYIKGDRAREILTGGKFDFACDCIDTLAPKVDLIHACLELRVPFVSSMGAGGKSDPTKMEIVDISETYNCNLARYVRKYLQKRGVRKGVTCVFSSEMADQSRIVTTEKAFPKKSIIGTVSYMPAIFGCGCASVAIRHIAGIH